MHPQYTFDFDRSRMTPKLNIISYDPTPEMVKQNHFVSTPVQTMYIMADLSNTDA